MKQGRAEQLAEIAYRAYGDAVGWQNVRGDLMPEYDDLGPKIQGGWEAAAIAVYDAPRESVREG